MSKSSKKLIKEFQKHKFLLFIALTAMLFSGLTSVLPSWFVKISIDGLAAIQNKVNNFSIMPQQLENWFNQQNIVVPEIFTINIHSFKYILPIGIVLVFLIEALFKFSYQYTSRKLSLKIVKDIRERFHRHVSKLSMKDINKIDSGSLVSVVSSDLQSLQSWLAESLINLFSESFKAIFLFSWLLMVNFKLTIISSIVIPLFAIPVLKLGKGIRNNARTGQNQVGTIASYISETINNQEIVKAFNLEDIRDKNFTQASKSLFETFKKWALYMALVSPITNILGAIGISAILFYGLSSVMNNSLTVGEFSSFFVTSLLLYDPVKRLGRVSTIFQSALGVADRFYEILEIPIQSDLNETQKVLSNAQGEIEIKNLNFSYSDEQKLFEKLNLNLKANSSLALVGPSGSGKSSLIALLLRFHDINSGEILIDKTNIYDLSLKNLREQFALVTQEAMLFSGSIKENILYGLGSNFATTENLDELFQRACDKSHVTEFLSKLPEKENSLVQESGSNLSIGQKQRISLARAFISNAPIVILDEPTSALDNESQELVYQAIKNLMQEKTVIIIAHRLSTIEACDNIVYLEDGQIKEQGNHKDLSNSKSLYAALLK